MKTRERLARRWGFVLASVCLLGSHAGGTGYYGPSEYLQGGGRRVDEAPEFYWDLEVKRLARAFRPADAPKIPRGVFPPQLPQSEEGGEELRKRTADLTQQAEAVDFDAALKEGRLKPRDANTARQQHEAVRAFLQQIADAPAPLPAEEPSEFADYHRGAYAFRQGAAHYPEARAQWEKLLARPAAERHFRSVWAAFMLGKLALKEGKLEAAQWFQKTRALAREGFPDSLALAADSYGWEARGEWKQGRPEKAAPLFLTQLALGDESAVISLKALIPDRDAISGMLNYGPEPEEMENWTEAQKKADAVKKRAGLRKMAADPLLRRLETVHILATETAYDNSSPYAAPEARENRIARWLNILKDAGVKQTDEAEYLGWAAYRFGDYKGAARWLEMAKAPSTVAHWLRAKLLRREGRVEDAARSMVEAWRTYQSAAAYSGWQRVEPEEKEPDDRVEPAEGGYDDRFGFTQHAGGDLGALQLARGDFLQAFEAFYRAGLWEDAAFVAESILSVDELKAYVDEQTAAHPIPVEEEKRTPSDRRLVDLRYLLGRRMVRVDRYTEAAAYLKPPYDKLLALYVKALEQGADAKLDKPTRAATWFRAAWIARFDGMELMGTEVAPDGTISEGSFPNNETAQERRTGKFDEITYDPKTGEERKKQHPIVLKATEEEVERLSKFRTAPDVRYHYRVIAAVLAMKAAALLPDNAPELGDVINKAGNWASDRDNKAADHYFATLKLRAAKTEIGRAALNKRWFVEQEGPWSQRERAAREARQPKEP